MIKYKNGDIFKGTEDIIIHGCNCFHTMGGGIAYQVQKLYPGAYREDKRTIKGDKNKLGTYSYFQTKNIFNTDKDIFIINAYTQYSFGTEKTHADYKSIEEVMIKINNHFKEPLTISMPKIGCGLAGGNWNIVEKIIEKVFDNREIFVYIY